MLNFSSKVDLSSYIISLAKSAFKKIGALFHFMFLSPEVAVYLYKTTIQPCMWYCCYTWAGTPICYLDLDLLDKLQKQICRIVSPSLAGPLEPLAHRRNVASPSLCYRYNFGGCSCELAQLVPLLSSRGRSTHCLNRSHGFSVTFPRCYKDVYVKDIFARTARIWNSLPIELFPLTYDLNWFGLELTAQTWQQYSMHGHMVDL